MSDFPPNPNMAQRKPDYLRRLSTCRTLDTMADLVRAFGLRIVAGIREPIEAHTMAVKYEIDAKFVENNCETWQQARKYLATKGYF